LPSPNPELRIHPDGFVHVLLETHLVVVNQFNMLIKTLLYGRNLSVCFVVVRVRDDRRVRVVVVVDRHGVARGNAVTGSDKSDDGSALNASAGPEACPDRVPTELAALGDACLDGVPTGLDALGEGVQPKACPDRVPTGLAGDAAEGSLLRPGFN
tara:strand:- start:832 stop:1296 length:465 start_codon:yes stop_codon:yes gene_type:complete